MYILFLHLKIMFQLGCESYYVFSELTGPLLQSGAIFVN